MRKYDDILFEPHHVSATRGRMSCRDRAAQFAPFAALTGFDGAIAETARLTEDRIELDECEKGALNEQLQRIQAHIRLRPEITFTRFLPDERKAGGAYVRVTGRVKRIDELARAVVLTGGELLPWEDIYAMEGEILRER